MFMWKEILSWKVKCMFTFVLHWRPSQVATFYPVIIKPKRKGSWLNALVLLKYICFRMLYWKLSFIILIRRHRKCRNAVERTFTQLKRRFYMLHAETRLSPGKACKLFVSCCILHNIAKRHNLDEIEGSDNEGE